MLTDKKGVVVSLDEMEPVITECLAASGTFSFFPKGTSMLPMIRQGIDQVTLSKLPEKLKKYDIILYKRKDGQFVLHRLVKKGETFGFLGDNQYEIEYGVERCQMIGRVSSFTRKNKTYSVKNLIYKSYCFFWYKSRHFRKLFYENSK